MIITSIDTILTVKYSQIGIIEIELKDHTLDMVSADDASTRHTSAGVASKHFRDFFGLGIKSSYSFKKPDEKDDCRDQLFKKKMVSRTNWKTFIQCLDPALNYDYKTVYYLLHYLRDNRPNKLKKDELVNHLTDKGCMASEPYSEIKEQLETIYNTIKN
ncbi:MAG: hypothetical protein GQ477_05280 [Nanohaloarchaea archaeon]|nr:hypothetical protein [Candidatus Nanohaloarchaea archaeon]